MTHQRPLGEIAKLIRGISFPKESKSHEPRPGDVACLRTANVQRQVEWDDLWFVPAEHVKRQEQYVQPGDILISTANSYELVGKVAFVTATPHKSTLGAFISLIRPTDEVDPKFLYHQLAWGETQQRIRETASTTTNISNVSTKKLAGLELLLPSLDEQERIVAEIEEQFSRLDEAVANLKRVKANLKRYKAAVLKAAVEGRLVETEAELARREGRSYETGAHLLQRILETRRSQWKGKGKYKEPAAPDTTDLPELPEGWVWASLDQLTSKITSGSRDWSQYYGRGTGIFVLAQNVRPFNPDFSVQQFVDPPSSDSSCDRSRIQDGDLLATIVGANAGQICLVAKAPSDAYVCQSVALIRPVLLGTAAHLNYWLNSAENGQRYLDQCMYGQGRPHLSFEQLMAAPIALLNRPGF